MMSGRLWAVAVVALAFLGCGSGSSSQPQATRDAQLRDDGGAGGGKLQVYGSDIGADWANVSVKRDGVPVTNASVVVNGVTIPGAPQLRPGLYSGQLPPGLAAGQVVSLEVTSGRATVTGIGAIPESPALRSPSANATRSPNQDVAVAWTSATDPDYFAVSAQWSCGTDCGTGVSFEAFRSTRAFTIPASALPSDRSVTVSVFAYDDGALDGDYRPWDPYPGMNIRAESAHVTVALSTSDPACEGMGYCMPETASCTASCQCCTGLCSPSGLCELVGAQEYSVGARFSVQLPGIEGTGYMWTVAPLPPAVVQVGDATSACNPSALGTPVVGCADTTTFLFEAEAPGQGTLTFAYARPWMADVAPLKTYQTAVRVY